MMFTMMRHPPVQRRSTTIASRRVPSTSTSNLRIRVAAPATPAAAQSRHHRLAATAAATPHRSRAPAVRVEANLFARVSRIVKSFVEGVVSSGEDPERLLDTVMEEMGNDLVKMRQAGAQVMASQKMLESKYKQSQRTADDWLRRAELAVRKGEEDLAKEALSRRRSHQTQADGLKTQLELQQKALDQLLANTRMLESKLAEARSKKDTLKARAASARTSKQIQEMIGSLTTSNAVVAFDKMEERVMAMEAEAEAIAMLPPISEAAGGMQGSRGGIPNSLEARFALLEAGTVEDDLAALKSGLQISKEVAPALAPGRAPVQAEPRQQQQQQQAGRPLREALDVDREIDLQLQELRAQASGSSRQR